MATGVTTVRAGGAGGEPRRIGRDRPAEPAAVASPTLRRVLEGQLCSGCGLCASLSGGAVRIEETPAGYNRPRQLAPLPPGAEAAIAATCPGAVVAPWIEPVPTHPYWGPHRSVRTGWSTDADVRFRASSGGMLSALLIHALESGMVDVVVHIAADPERPTRNVVQFSRTPEQIVDGAGSRYAPSSPLEQIESVLSGTERAAFVGKPCDVSALRMLARIDPRVNERIPLMLAFFCAGIPSHRGTDRILELLGVGHAELARFRYRGDGWPGFATAVRRDGTSERMSYMESWGDQLSKVVQFRCKICPDAIGGVADVACGDAWHGDERGYPLFEEQDGRSLLLGRTAAGEALIASALAAGAIQAEPLDVDEIDLMMASQAQRKRQILARLAALAVTFQPRYRARSLKILAASRRASPVEQAKGFAGLIRRVLQGRK